MKLDNNQISPYLEAWYGRKNGGHIKSALSAVVDPILDLSFGYHILQIGALPGCELYRQSPINHRIYASDQAGSHINLIANSDELPLDSDSVDIVIAHHSLEFGPNPHRVLRETQRVLAPQGRLIIIGFNPYSALGLAASMRRIARNPLWQAQHPVSRHRATDWLHLLGFELQSCHYVYTVPPIGGGKLRHGLSRLDSWANRHNIPSGGLYVLHAIKQVSALQKPRLGLRERGGRLIGLAVPKPAVAPRHAPAVSKPLHLVKNNGEDRS